MTTFMKRLKSNAGLGINQVIPAASSATLLTLGGDQCARFSMVYDGLSAGASISIGGLDIIRFLDGSEGTSSTGGAYGNLYISAFQPFHVVAGDDDLTITLVGTIFQNILEY